MSRRATARLHRVPPIHNEVKGEPRVWRRQVKKGTPGDRVPGEPGYMYSGSAPSTSNLRAVASRGPRKSTTPSCCGTPPPHAH